MPGWPRHGLVRSPVLRPASGLPRPSSTGIRTSSREAHQAGLTVTAYTFRASNPGRFASVREEMSHFLYTLEIDALFTDNPDLFPR